MYLDFSLFSLPAPYLCMYTVLVICGMCFTKFGIYAGVITRSQSSCLGSVGTIHDVSMCQCSLQEHTLHCSVITCDYQKQTLVLKHCACLNKNI